jgi:hypothetical protein
VGAGLAGAVLASSRTGRLTLALLDDAGRRLASVSGRRRVSIRRILAAGTYTLRISSSKPTKYRLQLDYMRHGSS